MNEEQIKSFYLREREKWNDAKEQGLVFGEFMPFHIFIQSCGFLGPVEDRKERLNSLSKQFNGGKNSGNHNPGQGRGVGKPAGGSSRTKVFDNPWFAGAYYWEPLSDLETYPGGPTDKEYFRQKGIATKVVEIKPEDYLKMIQKGGHSTEWDADYLASHEASQEYKEKILKEEPLATPDFELKEDGTISGQEGRHRSSGAALAGVKAIPVMITYHVQADNIDDFLKDFEYKDITDEFSKLVTDYKKKLKESRYNRLTFLEKTLNGGKNSGNHNPGQGRGVGKPRNGSYSYRTGYLKGTEESLEKLGNKSKFSRNLEKMMRRKRLLYESKEHQEKIQSVYDTAETLAKELDTAKSEGIDIDKIQFGFAQEFIDDYPNKAAGSTIRLGTKQDDIFHDDTYILISKRIPTTNTEDYLFYYTAGSKHDTTALSYASIFRHELGHAAMFQLMEKTKTEYYVLCDNVVKEALGKSFDDDTKMSAYGHEDASEFIAESWANPDYSEDAKKVYEYVKGLLND